MSSERTPQISDTPEHDAAEALRAYAKDKNVALWKPDSGRTRIDVSKTAADRGLSFLAKRAYEQLHYDNDQAKDAAIMLSALFVERIGANPELSSNAQLSIFPDHAELISDGKNVSVSFEGDGTVYRPLPVRIGLDLPQNPQTPDTATQATLAYDSKRDLSFFDFLLHFYIQVAHYSINDASSAAARLQADLTRLNNGPIQAKDGNVLLVSRNEVRFQKGPEWLVLRINDEAALVDQHETVVAAVEARSREERLQLRGEIEGQTASGEAANFERFNNDLGNQLVSIPNLIVYGRGPFGRGEKCDVFSHNHYYTVLRTPNNDYRVFDKNTENGSLGLPLTDWTPHFEEIKRVLA